MKWMVQAIFVLALISPEAYAVQSLGAFVDQILETNPAIHAAKSSVLAAKAREQASGQPLYNPEFQAEVQNAIENTRDIGISQTFDWANKRGARSQVASATVLTFQANLMQLRQQLITEVLSALATYQFQQEIVLLAKRRTSFLQKFVRLTNKQYIKGDVARIDLDLAKFAVSEAIAQQANAEINANQALQKLRATTGLYQQQWPYLSAKLPILSFRNIDTDQLINHLPSVLAINQAYQTAKARIRLAEKERYPDPTVSVQWGRQYEQNENKKLIGATFSIPLFIRNSYRAEVDAANYDAIEADKKLADLARQVRAEIKGSAERYQILYRTMKQLKQSSDKSLSDGMLLIERLWQAGEMNSTDYIVQLKQRIDSQIASIELKNQAWEAWFAWLKASGQVENWLQLESSRSGV